jgi:hypothetical protein
MYKLEKVVKNADNCTRRSNFLKLSNQGGLAHLARALRWQ